MATIAALSADYPTRPNYAERPDHDERALVIRCISLDPLLRPVPPAVNPYDFTLPRETFAKYYRRHGELAEGTTQDRRPRGGK